jgi:Zn-dependent peptidase ImmA (M78 family)/DNA-binding XRE family transcriptional regulator
MGKKSPEIRVSPSVLAWARTTSGYSVEDAADKLGVTPEVVRGWEAGTVDPTLSNLKSMSNIYKRSLAALLYPEPPREKPLPTDFRTLPSAQKGRVTSKTRMAIRKARRMQSIADDIFRDLNIDGTLPHVEFSTSLDPEAIASRARETMQLNLKQQFALMDSNEAFRTWRGIFEEQNVLVFQETIPLSDTRGFSLAHERVPVIVVSSADAINGRIFTLFHEYAHLLLREEGLCLPSETGDDSVSGVEPFCNAFAGAILVPESALRDLIDAEKLVLLVDSEVSQDSLTRLSNRFRVSKEVVLRRLLRTGLIDRSQYQNKLVDLVAQYNRHTPSGFGHAGDRAERSLRESGKRYVLAVLDASEQKIITRHEALEFLSIRSGDFNELKAMVLE